MDIKKVVIIGAGTMGSGIAAQVANAGIPVFLLDLPSSEGSRNLIVERAKERILNSKPPFLIEKSKIDLISSGNVEDNFNLVADADWVVEAVVERINIKHNIYKKIEKVRKKNSIISSNTSTIPLKVLSENMSDEMKKNFCITHFFNPVRYMRLLEIVTEPVNDEEKINLLKSFCDEKLGKGVILCKDTPGFLGNRVGVYAIQVAMTEAMKMSLTIEDADAIFGRPMGIPKTGVFGLYDLIGLDLMADVLKSFIKELPKDDPFHEVAHENPLTTKLINEGYTGRKGKGGFYRMNKEGGKKVLESINLQTGKYFPSKKVDYEKMAYNQIPKKLLEYREVVQKKIINYAASLVPGVTEEHNNIDEAMRLGFNWTKGPFEMLCEKGLFINGKNESKVLDKFSDFIKEKLEKLKKTRFEQLTPIEKQEQKKLIKPFDFNKTFKRCIPSQVWYGPEQVYLDPYLPSLKRIKQYIRNDFPEPIFATMNKGFCRSAKLYSHAMISPYYSIVEFTTKANTLDANSMLAIDRALSRGKPIIIINDGMQFSAGVNLNYVMELAINKELNKIEKFISEFQKTCMAMKYYKYPVIAAPSGLAIGGGFEVVAQSNYVISHTNVVLGLVETLVGLVPAGGGCKEMLIRWMHTDEAIEDPNYAPLKVFDLIGYAKIASSPDEAFPLKLLLSRDKVVINRDRLLHESEKLLDEIKKDYKPHIEPIFKLPGSRVRDKMYEILENLYREKKILDHGMQVGKQLAFVLSGGNTTIDKLLGEEDIYALELEAFMNLIQMSKTQERIKYTLESGKPLLN